MPTQPMETVAEELSQQPYDASDPQQVNEARKKAGRKRKSTLEFMEALMAVPEGRAWVYDKLAECHIYSPTFVPNDPYMSAFNEGMRQVGLGILADVMAAAEDRFLEMCKEAKNRK